MGTQQEGIFLPGLARAFQSVDTSGDLSTLQFAKACDAILPVFDRLGKLQCHKCRLMDSATTPFGVIQQCHERILLPNKRPKLCAGAVFAFAKSELIAKVYFQHRLPPPCRSSFCLCSKRHGAQGNAYVHDLID